MRKFLLSILATMMTISMMAVGAGTGKDKNNAIDFDWDGVSKPEVGTTSWYSIKLSGLSKEAEDPTVALYLTNLTTEEANVELTGSAVLRFPSPISMFIKDIDLLQYTGNDATETYSIAGKKHVVWTLPTTYDLSTISEGQAKDALKQLFGDLSHVSLIQLVEYGLSDVALGINPDQAIAVSADVYETEEIVDDACTKAEDFSWEGETVTAGEKWFYLDLNAVKNTDKKLNFVIENNSGVDAIVAFDLYGDCPASAILLDRDCYIAPDGEVKEALGRFFLDQMKKDYVYLKLTTDKTVTLKAVEEELPPPVELFDPSSAPVLEIGKEYALNGETVLQVNLETLKAPLGYKTVCKIENPNDKPVYLKQEIAFSTPVTSNNVQEKNLLVAAGDTTLDISSKAIAGVKSDVAYFRLTTAETLNLVIEHVKLETSKPVDPSNPSTPSTPSEPSAPTILAPTCEESYAFDWNSSIKQKALMTKWYELDITSLKKNEEHVQLSFTNNTDSVVLVMGSILLDCQSTDTIPFVCPVPAGRQISKVLDYSLLAASPLSKAYVSLTMMPTSAKSISEFSSVRSTEDLMKYVALNFHAEIEITAKRISALVDPTICQTTHQVLEQGVKYTQEKNVTKWYRVTDEFIKSDLGLLEPFAIINQGSKDANVTLGVTVDCKYGIYTTVTQSIPTWFDLTTVLPTALFNLVDSVVSDDITEFYVSITSDQPIAFGIDIDYGFGLGCDDAREFDWTKGSVINKGDAQWLSFDITSVKENKQQVRLTLTNESNSLAWVAMLTSLTCPFDVALPMVFAIPAGMSIDKVVDYSYFAATKLDQLYVALITEETISVKAVAEKSQASASDYAACENAVEVKNGEAYVQKAGTTWYKFDRSLFSDVSRLPKFRYAAEATTSLTMGVTVGCEYNIATRGTIKLPTTKGLEVSFRMPGFIYDVLDKFVHDDVEAVYVEMTTDQQIKFGIDMEYAGGCEKAAKLDLSKPLDIDLTANKDVWYYLDLKDVRAMGDEKISFRLNNQSDKAVEVEFEVTPTCPLVVSAIKSVDIPAGVDLPLMVRASAITDLYDQVVAKFDVPDKIANNLPEQLTDDLIYYVRVRANGDLSIEEGDSIPEHVEPGCEVATPLDITKAIDVDNLQKGWYVVDLTTINKDFTLKFINNTGSNQTVDFQFYKGCDQDEEKMLDNYLTSYNLVVPTTGIEQKVPYSLISSYLTIDELYIYVNKTEGGEVDMACASALLIDLNNPFMIELEEGKEQWFKIAPKDYENFDKNLVISTKNLSGKSVNVDFSLATACPALVTVDSTITVNGDLNRVDSITAGMIDLAWDKFGDKVDGIDTAYVRVLANGNLQLVVDTFTVVIPEMPEGCENAKELDWTKTINLSQIQTGWYHVDLTPLKNGQVKAISVNNDLGEETGVKFDIFRSCEENSFLYTYTHAFKVGMFNRSIPSAALSMLGSINELYIYITVGVDVLTCEDAIEFDWSKGAVHQAGSTQWYHFDINPIKANNQQVKLTFTNHSNELAVMYGEVALHCPYTYSIPYACVVPPGMSIDKVVDYSVFAASRVEELYVKVYSNETIELGATTESAEVFDNAPCDNAPTVKSGVKYTQQAGTSWYRLPKSLFKKTGKLPKFYFTTEEEGLTKITLGATVGCDHNIATKTIFMLPGSLNYAMVVHEKIFEAWDMLVNDEVTEVYVEVTTDKAVSFSVDMINDTDDPCHAAELLDVTKGINLEANKEKWYKIDVDALKAMKSDVAVKLINPSASVVTLDMEFSPTCPVVVSLNKSLSIPAIPEISKIISQETLAKIPGVSIYVRFESTADVQITFSEPEIPEYQAGCEDAILLDWTKTIDLASLDNGWYKLNISSLRASKNDFTLSLNNNTGDVKKLTFDFYKGCSEEASELAGMYLTSLNITAPTGITTEKVPYAALNYLLGDDIDEFYIYLTIDGGELNEACLNAMLLDDPNVPHTIQLVAGKEQWFKVATNALEKLQYNLKVSVDAEVSDVTVSVSSSCLVDPVIDTTVVLDQARHEEVELSKSTILDKWSKYSSKVSDIDTAYVRVLSTGNITLSTDTVTPTPPADPDACENATLLDWTQTVNLSTLTTGWYKFDISSLHASQSDFTLSLNNDMGETKAVEMTLYLSCDQPYEAKTTQVFPVGITTRQVAYSLLTQVVGSADMVYVYIKTDIQVPVIPEADACLNAIELTWNDTLNINAGDTTWYMLPLAEAKALGKDLELTVSNNSGSVANVYVAVAEQCPVVAFLTERRGSVEPGSITKLLKHNELNSLADTVYFLLSSTEELSISVSVYNPVPPTEPDSCLNGTLLDWTQTVNLSTLTTGWYKFDISSLHASQSDFTLSLNNDMGETKAVEMTLYLSCDQPYEAKTTQVFPVGITTRQVAYSLLTQVVGSADMVYVYIKTDIQVPVIPEADACLNAIELTWNDTLHINAGDTTWYMLPLAEAKALGKDLELTVSNNSGSVANVYVAVAEQCPVVAFLTERRGSVEPGSITKLLKHNELNSLADTVYFLLSSTEELSISVSVYNPVPPTEPDSCLNGTLLDWTQTVNLSTLTTGWYKFDISSLHASQSDFTLSLNNDMGETKAVEMTLYLSCDQPYEAKTTQVFPVGITTRQIAYSLLTQVVGSADMVYVYIKTDIQVPVIPEADACLNAIELTWNDTLNINAGDTTWYMLPLAEAKALGKDLELTVSNNSGSVANVYVAVAEQCPVVAFLTERRGSVEPGSITKLLKHNELNSLADTVYFLLSSTEELSISVSVYNPVPPTEPDSCLNGTLLDWTQTVNLSTLTTGWYKFDISSLHASQSDFTLSLNNDMGETKAVEMTLYLSCDQPYEAKTTQVFPVGITTRQVAYSLLTQVVGSADMVYVYIKTDIQVPVIPEADACLNAIELTWNDTLHINAGDTTWYMLPLAEAKALGKDLTLTVNNSNDADANVYVAVAETCPVLAYLTERTGTVPANMTISRTLSNSELTSLADTVYFRLSSTQDLTIVAGVAVEEPEQPEGCENATLLDWTKTINLSDLKTGWYKFDISSLHTANKDFTLSLNNDLGEAKNLGFRLYKDCDSPMMGETVMTFPVGITSRTIPANLLSLVDGIDMLYVYLTIDAPLPCEGAILFDWNKGAYQEANKTQWYEFDITPVLEQEKQVKLTFTNHSNENAWVIAELAFHCPYTKSIPIIVPVPANMSVDKWIDYSAFEASRIEHFYMGVTTREAAIELAATWEDARVTPSDGCLNATLVQTDSLYEHAAGTHWYKLTGDLFEGEGMFSRVHVINRSAKTVNITAGGTVGCEYNIATRTSFKLPRRFDLAFAIPVWVVEQMKKFVDDDVKEFYLELTTDQPIAFSFGMDACEEAIPFDWTTGHTQEALTTQWYNVDIAPVLANEQQIKLTLTNHSNQTAWVATLVSLDCPFKVALPLAFPIPAGMSVDKVIDYSYFAATKLDQLYVGVTTDSKISIIAEAQSAEASSTDQQGCANATLLKNGEKYTHPAGTSWYKVDGSLFTELGNLPKFRFATVSGETTKVTMGATVGCEYNIATKGTVNVPGGIDLSLRVPSFIFSVMKQFIRDDVNEIYVQLTTDKAVEFGVDMTTDVEDMTACEDAEKLLITDNMTVTFPANSDKWYLVDLSEIKQVDKNLSLTVITDSNVETIAVEAEVSPTCPVVVSVVKETTVAGSLNKTIEPITPAQLQKALAQATEDTYYVRVATTGDITITIKEYEGTTPDIPGEKDDCEEGKWLNWHDTIDLDTLYTGWYKIDVRELHENKADFTLSVLNSKDTTRAIEMTLYDECPVETYFYTGTLPFASGVTTQEIPYMAFEFFGVTADVLYAYIKTDAIVPEEIVACMEAEYLNVSDPMNIVLEKDVERWYKIATADFDKITKDMRVEFINHSSDDVNVELSVSPSCPVQFTLDTNIVISGSYNRVDTIPATLINSALNQYGDKLSGVDTAYIRVLSTGKLSLTTDTMTIVTPEDVPAGCDDAIELDWSKTINLSDLRTGWYKFDISSLHASKKDFTLSLNNDMGELKSLGFNLYKGCDSDADIMASMFIASRVMTFPVGITSQEIPYTALAMVASDVDMLYVYLTIDAKLPCEDAILFDWNKGAYQEANKTQWYEFDITPVLEQEKQVKLTFTNHSNENAWVIAELAFHCPYTKSIPIIVPVPANMSVDKWIDYSAFEASRIEHFYMGVTTREAAIELAATWEDARVAPSDGCLNATLVKNDSLYEHAAGTHWYKFTGDLFEGEGMFSRVHVINRSAKTVNVTAGGTVGCEYNIATRTSFKLPRRFDLAFAIPVWVVEQMKKFIDDDVTEFYLELTTDQPIAFSFGMDACEEAIPFDWTTGHTQEALTTQWYNVDIAPVLANEQQIKLTFTNHSDQTAWVGTLVSLDCPFKVALPLAFPIPAGMSVDKVIDYSYFAATRLDQLYVGVTTDSKISVIAEAQSAEASSTDQQGCANATLLKNGEKYTHPAGTSWYKVDGSFFANMSSLPTFRFATVSGETTKVTVGATVGCEYNIATKGTVNVPGGIDLSLRVPSFIFKVLKKFVRDDVNEFYVQISTDKSIDFAIDTTTTEDLTACLDAIDLVVTDSMTIDLAANTDQWYRVDLSALKGTNKDLAVKVVNPSDAPVNVEVEASTVCPVVASVIKEATVPASLNVTKVITAEQIAKLFEKYPDLVYYVRVSTSGDLHAEISEYIPPVDGCADAIEYVWGSDLEVNANEEGWYKLAIVDLRNQDCNIKLTVKNSAADTVTADVAIYETCPIDIPLVSMDDLAIAPTTTRVEEVSADYLPDDVDTVYLHIKPTGKLIVNVSTNCVPDPVVEFAYDTISALICDNSEYISPVSKAAHLISSANASSLTWNDTVHVHATLDSVYTFMITPIVAPQVMTDSLLETIYGTMPLLTPGKVANVDAALIMDYYHANDTESIADVIDVAWKTSTVDCNATTHVMTLVVKDDCGNEITTTHSFPVDVHPTGEIEYAMICDGEDYRWNGQRYDSTGVYSITIQDINGCDSVATLNLTVLPATQFITETKVVCYGESYTWNGQVCDQSREYSHTVKNALACDSIVYTLQLTVLPQPVEVEEYMTICSGDYTTWHGNHYDTTGTYTYEVTNEHNCIDTIYTLNLKVLPKAKDSIDRYFICEGDSLTWKDGNTYSTDIVGPTYSESYTHSTCDSITYHLDLKVVSNEPIYDGFCYGDTYSFTLGNGVVKSYDSTGVYVEQLGNCDLLLYLTEYDPIPVTYVDTTVCYGAAFTWNGMDINATLSGDTTFVSRSSVHGCDSTIVLRWNVLQPAITVEKDTTICHGESFMWNGYTCNTSKTYTYIESNILGCDSIINVLNVTVLPNKVIDEKSLTICATEVPYAWYGQSLSATQTYYATEQFANQLCDSVEHILHLTVMPAKVTDEDSATICASELPYLWQGIQLGATGTYNVVEKFVNANCDSIEHILHLIVNQPVETHETVVACGSYEWNGVTYSKNGDYQVEGTAANGCDSIAYLHLTVYTQEEKEYSKSICSGEDYTWPVNNQTYDNSGVYEYVEYHAGTTCPSVVHTLTLDVLLDGEQKEEYKTICEGDTLPWNGQILTTSGDYVHTLPGCNASIILHLTVKPIAKGEETITACDSYLWNGTKYTESDDYTFITKGNGETCDSIATLHLTINKSVRTEVDTVACDSLEWNGQMYKKSGYYTQSFTTINGCDSTVIMHLTINNSIKTDITEIACDKFTWDGTTYTTSGDYTKNYTTVAGCDSIVTLHLTINESYNVKDTVVVCEAYDWNNTTYTESGDYVGTFTSVTGCDSIVNLHLVVLPAPVKANIEEQTICTGDYVQWRGNYYSQPGFHYDTVLNTAGCADTIYSLHITEYDKINPYVIDKGICYDGSYTWPLTGKIYDQPGFYPITLQSVNGCDSVVTLHLIVHEEVKPTIQTSTICYGDTLYWNSKAYTTTTKDTIVLVDKFGCDSIICLDLTVLPEIPVQIESATVNYGEPYYWNKNGKTYYGTIKDTAVFTTANGCDSIWELQLTELPPVLQYEYKTIEDFVCDGTGYEDPITKEQHIISSLVTSTQTWQDTVHVSPELDSIYVFKITPTVAPAKMTDATLATIFGTMPILTPGMMPNVDTAAIKNYYDINDNDTISDVTKVTWIAAAVPCGATTHTMTLVVEDECDNILKTEHIFPVAEIVKATPEEVTICHGETFLWNANNMIYSEANVYKDTLQSTITGCDSIIVTLNLTVRPEIITVVDTTVCRPYNARPGQPIYVWREARKTYTQSAKDTVVFGGASVTGCDSTVILNLTINEPTYGDTTAVICSSELPYMWYEHTLNATGTATHTLTNVAGCDSIVTLHLTVNEPSYGDTTAVICSSELPFIWYEHTLNATGTATHTLTNVAGCDSIVTLHLTVNEPSYGDTTAVICSSELPYMWYEHTLNATGTATHTLTNVAGCDSIVTLHLTVNEPSYGDTTAVICSSELPFIWYEHTLNATGTATHTLTNVAGCDSIVTLHLTVNEPSYGDTTAVICSSELPFIWYEHTLNATGTATHTLTNVAGCDSIVTLHLTVNEPSYGDTTAVICSSELPFIWYEHTLNATGTATHTLTNVAGCDSIVTLHLTVNEPSYGDTTAVICSSELPFIWYEHTLNATGTATHTLTNVAGCDSIVTLHLTVNEPSYGDTTAVICSSELPFIWYEHTLNATGTATHTLTNVAGCDSIVTLHLTVNEPSYGDTTAVICSSELPFIWYEHTLNATGTATHTLTNVAGCDSIVTLHLTVNEPSYGDTTAVICSSELPFIWYEHTLNATGTATHTLTNVAGCDSIVTLHLTVNEPSYGDTTAVICSSELPFIWYEHTLNATGTATHTLTNVAGCDSIVTLHLTVNEPSYGDTTAVICSSELPFIWYEHTLNATGTATHTLTNVAGCDSIVTLHLTVNEPSYGDTTAVICSSELPFIWYEHTLNATGTATHTLTNVAGCDSIVTLHLTVNEPSYGDTTAVICSSELPYMWYEHTLNATGTATHTLTNVAGCDSIVTLHLTVNEPSYGDTTAVICSSELPYMWYEHTLNATGTATHTLTNVAGCDSIVTLHLTVNEPSYGDTTAVICSSELPFIWYEHTLNATGTATHTLTNVAGCDSIVTLHLTVNEPSYGDTTAVICSSELPFIWYEHTLNATGTATHTLTNVAGCDSIVTLHLTVNEPSYGDTTAVICSSELPYMWYEHTLNATGTATHTLTNVAGCDSIVTLHLTVNEPSYGDTTAVICSSELPFIWYEHTLNATGTATHTLTNAAGCDSIVTLHLTVLDKITLPNVTAEDIVAICGKAIDVTTADAIIQSHIAAYDWVENLVWEVLVDGKWVPLTSDAIDGGVEMVTIRYTILTACEDLTDTLTVVVENPNPENSEELANAPAYNKYGGRLLTLDLQYIVNEFGWNIAEEDVTWYLVVEGGDDIPQGTGYYLTTEDGAPLPAGSYYALIERPAVLESDCDVVLQTVILVVETQVGPLLAPTVAKPHDVIRLLNLDADMISTVRMYSAAGELLDTFQVKDMKETSFHAAQSAGYYIVEVQTETEKVSLRYIVK